MEQTYGLGDNLRKAQLLVSKVTLRSVDFPRHVRKIASNEVNSLRIPVVGGAGYIGSHAAHALSDAGFTPIVYDNFSTGSRQVIRGLPVIEGDLNGEIREKSDRRK